MIQADVAVIGAGMAGLSCAQALHARGAKVTVFDKGRRAGGRLATRRLGDAAFNHGAQFATAKGEAFQRFLSGAGNLVAPWDRGETHPRWVGVPGMSAFAQVAERNGIGRLVLGRQVTFLSRAANGWMLRHLDAMETRPGSVIEAGESAGPFERVVLALPPAQAAALLDGFDHLFGARVAWIRMQPCWALMLAFGKIQPGADRRTVENPSPLAWIARDSSRPGRGRLPDAWVGHATAEWSREHLEDAPDAVLTVLHRAFHQVTGVTAHPVQAAVHRWRYAQTDQPLGEPCLWDPAGLAVCGDWCLGARIEAAFDSGVAAAAEVLRALP